VGAQKEKVTKEFFRVPRILCKREAVAIAVLYIE
jgi:hypothetical protein